MQENSEQVLTPLAQYLKAALEERHMSITTLSKGSGLSQQTIKTFLKGQRPNLDSCRKMAVFLKVPLAKIISLSHDDVEEQRLQSLFELYEDLPEPQRQQLELFAFMTHQQFGKHERAGIHAVRDERV